jgi:hypothetical protein
MSKRKTTLSWLPDPVFRNGTVWDLCLEGERQYCFWVASSQNGYMGSIGECNYTEEVPTIQEAAKLVLKAYNAR